MSQLTPDVDFVQPRTRHWDHRAGALRWKGSLPEVSETARVSELSIWIRRVWRCLMTVTELN